MVVATILLCRENVRRQSVNDCWPCIVENAYALRWCHPIIALVAAFLSQTSCNNITTRSWKWASTECQRLLALSHARCYSCVATFSHKQIIGVLYRQKRLLRHRDYVPKPIVNGVSTTFGLVSWNIPGLCGNIKPWYDYRLPFQAKTVARWSKLCPINESQRSVNDFSPCILANPWAVRRHWHIIELSAVFLGKNAFVVVVTMP